MAKRARKITLDNGKMRAVYRPIQTSDYPMVQKAYIKGLHAGFCEEERACPFQDSGLLDRGGVDAWYVGYEEGLRVRHTEGG